MPLACRAQMYSFPDAGGRPWWLLPRPHSSLLPVCSVSAMTGQHFKTIARSRECGRSEGPPAVDCLTQ